MSHMQFFNYLNVKNSYYANNCFFKYYKLYGINI